MSQFNQHSSTKLYSKPTAWLYYQGCFLVFALVLGGGTTKGLHTDYILELAALPMIVHLFMRYRFRDEDSLVTVFFVGLVLVFVFQLVPHLPTGLEKLSFISIDAGRTIDSFLYSLTLVAVFYGIYSLNESDRTRVAPFLLFGFLVNFVFAVGQFSSEQTGFAIVGFPFVIKGGFFANYNHLASLFYVTIPFFVLAFHNRRFSFYSVFFIAPILVFLFLIGSLSGIMLGMAGFVISLALLGDSKIQKVGTVFVLVVGAVAIIPYIKAELFLDGSHALSRSIFAKNTIEAAMQYLPIGSGFGTFVLVYPNFAIDTGLFSSHVNHAHNDYLELLLEGGVPAGVLFATYVVLLVSILIKVKLSDLQKMAFLGIAFLLVHSVVDYPLRTLAMGSVFAFLNGLTLSARKPLRASPSGA